jgi:hypothetical protein
MSPKPNESKKGKISKLKSLSLNKNKLKSSEIMPPTIFRSLSRAKQNITLVKLLNIEDNFNTILNTDKEMERQKEKLNNNNLIKLVRLGLYKKKENDDDNNNETDKKEPETIAEKEKQNEENLDKINNENREREERVKRIFKEKLINLEKIKTECQKLNQKINKIKDSIDEYQMEVNVLVKYSDEFDERFLKNLNNQNQNDINDSIDNNDYLSSPNKNAEMHEKNKAKNKRR